MKRFYFIHIVYIIFLISISLVLFFLFKSQEKHFTGIISYIKTVEEKIDLLSEITDENDNLILEALEQNRANSDRQFSETQKIKTGYEKILDEQQKQHIDSLKKDSAVMNMTEEAEKLYIAGNFRESYKKFSDVLQYQPDNNEIRFKKAVSLFNINSMDSTKYNEILSDCAVLRKNGYSNSKLDEIEKHIRSERGE